MKLNAKQQQFVLEYLRTFNATKAAIAAGYSEASAYSQGSRLLKNAEVTAELERVYRENTMSALEVLHHLTEIARGDFADLVDYRGVPDMESAVAAGKSNLIKRVKQKTTLTANDKDGNGSDIFETEVEAYDRLKALELLAKYHDLINKLRVEDWRSQAIADIKAGRIAYQALAEAFDESLAAQLFAAAGVNVSVGASAPENDSE